MADTTYTIDLLIHKILSEDRIYDLDKIVKSYELAAEAHKEQKRSSGEPYIIHPLAVAYILLELGMDTDTICAAILHDVVEDTNVTLEQVRKSFGNDVAMLVDGVTKLGKIAIYTEEEQKAENIRKILFAMSKDIRVIIIKLCDRLHNMRTLRFRPKEKQRATAHETMTIYAPIAHRLGMYNIKDELEDLAFYYLDSFAYSEIEHLLEIGKDAREEFINRIKQIVSERLREENFPESTAVDGRIKTIYSIYKKIYLSQKSIDQIYDKYAIRVIVDNVSECYAVVGIIHDMFKPIPNRFKDYIANPKANGYQSLHSTVLGRDGIPFEVQIRTWDMHYIAEHGIAAHWKYKEGISSDSFESQLAWICQILEAQKVADDVEEIFSSIKTDIAPDDVFAFTPKGMMITLPVGATIIDFAYRVHTQIGNSMVGAKVGGKIVKLDYKVQTGDIIEILTTKALNHGPSRDWLDMAATAAAKSKIRAWFKKEKREENIAEGKTIVELELRKQHITIPQDEMPEFFADEMKRHQCANLEDYYAKIGYGGAGFQRIGPRLREHYEQLYSKPIETETPPPVLNLQKNAKGVIVEGVTDCAVKFAQCCNPLPGDEVVGYITRGHGISLHKTTCKNYINSSKDEENKARWLGCHWAQAPNATYKAVIDIIGEDRHGLLLDVCAVFADARITMHNVTARELSRGMVNIVVTVAVSGVDQLSAITSRIERIKGVETVKR